MTKLEIDTSKFKIITPIIISALVEMLRENCYKHVSVVGTIIKINTQVSIDEFISTLDQNLNIKMYNTNDEQVLYIDDLMVLYDILKPFRKN